MVHAQLPESWLAVLMPPLIFHQVLQSLPIRLSSEGHCKHQAWLKSALLGSNNASEFFKPSAAT